MSEPTVEIWTATWWEPINDRRCHLIERKIRGVADDEDRAELASLQALASEYLDRVAPLDLSKLEDVLSHMKTSLGEAGE